MKKLSKGKRAKLFETAYDILGLLFRLLNFNKKKVLIYTDSRGYDVLSKNGRNPFTGYCKKTIFKFKTDFHICNEKHTTLLDFLLVIDSFTEFKYDAVILHCGIVDFSPRPISNLKWVLNSKKDNIHIKKIISKDKFYHNNPSKVTYNNEKTQNLYSEKNLVEYILPKLNKIENLIWINSNNFVKGWEGNFTKGRPNNINKYVSFFDGIMSKNIKNVIDLRNWSDVEIKKYTIDNIHFTKKGFEMLNIMVYDKLLSLLKNEK